MKTFFTLSILLISAFLVGTGSCVAFGLAFEGHPDEHHVVNGRYTQVSLLGGAVEYRSSRSDAAFTSPVIRYDLATGRWGLYVTRRSSGAQEMIARTSPVSSVDVMTRTWALYNYVGTGPVYVTPPVKAYEPIDQYTSCDNCFWTSAGTWRSGIVPRAYDNVIVNGNIVITTQVKCNNLEIWTGTASSPIKTLVGRDERSKLKILGNLRHGRGTLLDVTEVEFGGNTRQTIESGNAPNVSIYGLHIKINNPNGVQLNSLFRFFGRAVVESELVFVKGHLYLGAYDLTAENIVQADESRFIITNGNGMLKLIQRSASETLLQRFPVGPSIDRYTPMLVLFGAANRPFSGMRGRVAYNPSIFLSDDRINVVYTIDHGTAVTPTGVAPTWIYQFQWDAADATTGFNFSYPLQVRKWNGAAWGAPIARGGATGSGPYKLLFIAKSTGMNNFGLEVEPKALAGGRTAAEESEIQEPGKEKLLDFTTFPNPAPSSGFNVTVADPKSARLRLQNLSGVDVPIQSRSESENTLSIQPTQNLARGMYLLQVRENDQTRVHKVMIE